VATIWYYSVDNNSNVETAENVTIKIDVTPPASVSGLQSTSGTSWINWTWNNPESADFSHTMVYLNGIFKTTTSDSYYNATNLAPDTNYEIGTYTVDANGNVNNTWINQTVRTQVNSAPIANLTYRPENPIINQTITFNASNSTDLDGFIANYEWDFGDNSSTEGMVTQHTYSVNTSYIVSLTVTDDNGAMNQTSKNIRIMTPYEIYDTNGTSGIQKDEVSQALNDYNAGMIDEETMVAVILCYYGQGG